MTGRVVDGLPWVTRWTGLAPSQICVIAPLSRLVGTTRRGLTLAMPALWGVVGAGVYRTRTLDGRGSRLPDGVDVARLADAGRPPLPTSAGSASRRQPRATHGATRVSGRDAVSRALLS